jgi:nucleoid-associated protein YgaU
VRARAEVPFDVRDTLAAAVANIPLDGGSPAAVLVPKITTTTVSRGDSLWRISHLNYGVGTRYAVIYKANREQIRNPNLIYPGQIFVVPTRRSAATAAHALGSCVPWRRTRLEPIRPVEFSLAQ